LALVDTVKGVTAETGLAAAAAVGGIENPIISILLETVSPENNDASAFEVMALWGIDRSGVGNGRGSLVTTDTVVGGAGASITSVLAKTSSGEKLPEWSGTEASKQISTETRAAARNPSIMRTTELTGNLRCVWSNSRDLRQTSRSTQGAMSARFAMAPDSKRRSLNFD
jgi:hypothetical protein